MNRTRIGVIYHSQSQGNTAAAAEHLARGLRETTDLEVFLRNTYEEPVKPVVLADCAGVAFGTPDYFSYPAGALKVFMDDWLIAKRQGNDRIEDMPVALFMTHGGGGAAKGPFEELFHHVGPQVGETISIEGRPDEDQAEALRQLGAQLAEEAAGFAQEDS
ncbi:MAG: NAD(P)H-dependent oxidoreductase [Candidatus Brocadiia bacterium]